MILFFASAAYILFLLAYEFWAIFTKHETITDHIRDVQRVWGLFGPLLAGVTFGLLVHFFWT